MIPVRTVFLFPSVLATFQAAAEVYPKPTIAPKEVRSTNQFSVFLPSSANTMEMTMMNRMLYVVLENFSDRILSSAIERSTRVVARYPPMIPVRIAAAAVTVIMTRPTGPMMDLAA